MIENFILFNFWLTLFRLGYLELRETGGGVGGSKGPTAVISSTICSKKLKLVNNIVNIEQNIANNVFECSNMTRGGLALRAIGHCPGPRAPGGPRGPVG